MLTTYPTLVSYNGSGIDGGLFRDVTRFAKDTGWLNEPAKIWTTYAVGLFIVLLLVGWWISRRRDSRTMAASLASPICVIIAFAVTEIIKKPIAEVRPCRSVAHAFILETCPAISDYAMPSGHTTFAAACAAALLLVNRKLFTITFILAILEGLSRIYVGAHYPHDVLAGFIVAFAVAIPCSLLLRWLLTRPVHRLRETPLRPLLATSG